MDAVEAEVLETVDVVSDVEGISEKGGDGAYESEAPLYAEAPADPTASAKNVEEPVEGTTVKSGYTITITSTGATIYYVTSVDTDKYANVNEGDLSGAFDDIKDNLTAGIVNAGSVDITVPSDIDTFDIKAIAEAGSDGDYAYSKIVKFSYTVEKGSEPIEKTQLVASMITVGGAEVITDSHLGTEEDPYTTSYTGKLEGDNSKDEPAIVVSGYNLTDDYTVVYKDNDKAGVAKVTVTPAIGETSKLTGDAITIAFEIEASSESNIFKKEGNTSTWAFDAVTGDEQSQTSEIEGLKVFSGSVKHKETYLSINNATVGIPLQNDTTAVDIIINCKSTSKGRIITVGDAEVSEGFGGTTRDLVHQTDIVKESGATFYTYDSKKDTTISETGYVSSYMTIESGKKYLKLATVSGAGGNSSNETKIDQLIITERTDTGGSTPVTKKTLTGADIKLSITNDFNGEEELKVPYTGKAITPNVQVTLAEESNPEEDIEDELEITYARSSDGSSAPADDAYKSADETNLTDLGKVYVKVAAKSSSNVYEGAATPVSFEIVKGAAPVAHPEVYEYVANVSLGVAQQEIDLDSIFKFEGDFKVVKYKNQRVEDALDATNNVLAEEPKVQLGEEDTSKLTFETLTQLPEGEQKKATIKVDAEFENYEDATLTIEVTLAEKKQVTITGTIEGKVYDGEAFEPDLDSISIMEASNNVKDNVKDSLLYTYAKGEEMLDEAPKDAGTYTVTISVAPDNKNYSGKSEALEFTIDKAELTVTAVNRTWTKSATGPSSTAPAGKEDEWYTVTGLGTGDSLETLNATVTFKYTKNTKDGNEITDWTEVTDTDVIKIVPVLTPTEFENYTVNDPVEADLTVIVRNVTPVQPLTESNSFKASDIDPDRTIGTADESSDDAIAADTYDYTEDIRINGFLITAGDGEKDGKKTESVTVDNNSKTIPKTDGTAYTRRLKTGGEGSVYYRSIAFATTKAAKLYVACISSSSTANTGDRKMALASMNENGELSNYNATGTLKIDGTLTNYTDDGYIPITANKDGYYVEVDLTEAGTYYMYSTNGGINFYEVRVTYGDGGGEVTPDTVEAPKFTSTPSSGSVTITSATGTSIYYVTDDYSEFASVTKDTITNEGVGTKVDNNSTTISGLTKDTSFKAIAVDSNNNKSNIAEYTYTSTGTNPPAPIGQGLEIVLNEKEYTYTGSAIIPSYSVTYDDEPLIEGTDYTVKFSNNVKVSTAKPATITVTGKGNLSGKTSANFTITPKSLNDDDIKGKVIVAVTGTKPALPTLSYNGIKLTTKDIAFDPSFSVTKWSDEDDGTKVTIVAGKSGTFEGSCEVDVDIITNEEKKAAQIKKVVLSETSGIYNNTDHEPEVTVTVTTAPEGGLIEDTDYTVSYPSDMKSAGKKKITVTGISSKCFGTKTVTYTINPADKKNGKFIVKVNGSEEINRPFQSTGVTFDQDELDVSYSDGADVTIEDLKIGKDYKITYSNNKKTGAAKATVSGLGNYKGVKTVVEFGIAETEFSSSNVSVIVPDKTYSKPSAFKSTPVVIEKSSNTVLKSSAYTVSYTDENGTVIKEAAAGTTVYVRIEPKAKSGFIADPENPLIETYDVKESSKDLSTAKIKLLNSDGKTKFFHTGEPVKPNNIEITYKDKTVDTLTLGEDGKYTCNNDEARYELAFVNNINKGKATVIIQSDNDAYAVGGKTATFNIAARNLKEYLGW